MCVLFIDLNILITLICKVDAGEEWPGQELGLSEDTPFYCYVYHGKASIKLHFKNQIEVDSIW